MATLLVEIGCEELPAGACREALTQLPAAAEQALGVAPTQVLITPRRLAVLVDDVPARTPDRWVKGPPVNMAEKAAAGFAKRHGVAVEELQERDGFLGVEVLGKPLEDVLPEQVDALVHGLLEDDALGRQRPAFSPPGALAARHGRRPDDRRRHDVRAQVHIRPLGGVGCLGVSQNVARRRRRA
jgi:hypothetical protein